MNANLVPNGRWLARERDNLNLPVVDVAKAVGKPVATVRSIERHNTIVAPGWREGLLSLGVFMIPPRFASDYSGHALRKDLEETVGVRHSRYWLSKQLCVTEEVISEIIHKNLAVPNDWLLKLAELGFSVPPVVREALAAAKASSNEKCLDAREAYICALEEFYFLYKALHSLGVDTLGALGVTPSSPRAAAGPSAAPTPSAAAAPSPAAAPTAAEPGELSFTVAMHETRGMTLTLSPNMVSAVVLYAKTNLPHLMPKTPK